MDKKRTEKIFEYVELNFTNLTNQVNNWLIETYNKSSILFNSSSPYGQLLQQIKEFFRLNILYNKHIVRQLDIEQTNTKRMILNLARISGHNPSRAISAKGSLRFKLKQGVDIEQKIKGSSIVIYDNTTLKNKTNNLFYVLKIGTERNIYPIVSGSQFFIDVYQGTYESQTYTGTGEKNQSISVIIDNNQTIDNFEYQVLVDGINMNKRDHLYDMLDEENTCYTRTGFEGGLDVYFGNGTNGMIPPLGSVIEIKYLLTDGIRGNIVNEKVNDFEFVDDVYDSEGNTISPREIFDVYIENDITLASDGESLEYIKSVVPHVSRNFVLATPNQFIYHLKKLNMFSKVNVFNNLDMIKMDIDSDGNLDDININEIYLFLIPKITNYFVGDVNYFNVPFDVFYLDDYEKQRIITYLKMQGIISITSKISILDPEIKRYVVNIYVSRFDNESKESIKYQIIEYLSDYFASNDRYDRIIKADIIKGLKSIEGIDSLNVEFISKENEDYHKDGAILNQKKRNVIETTYATTTNINENKVENNSINSDLLSVGKTTLVDYKVKDYNKNKMLGIDPVMGDIIINRDNSKKNQLPILRGGWSDRNGIYYHEDPNITDGFSTINIIFKDNNSEYNVMIPIKDTHTEENTKKVIETVQVSNEQVKSNRSTR